MSSLPAGCKHAKDIRWWIIRNQFSRVHVYEHDLLRHQYYLVGWIANFTHSVKFNVKGATCKNFSVKHKPLEIAIDCKEIIFLSQFKKRLCSVFPRYVLKLACYPASVGTASRSL